jgi:hypothetical protein
MEQLSNGANNRKHVAFNRWTVIFLKNSRFGISKALKAN